MDGRREAPRGRRYFPSDSAISASRIATCFLNSRGHARAHVRPLEALTNPAQLLALLRQLAHARIRIRFARPFKQLVRNWFASRQPSVLVFRQSRHVPLEYLELRRLLTIPSSPQLPHHSSSGSPSGKLSTRNRHNTALRALSHKRVRSRWRSNNASGRRSTSRSNNKSNAK